MPIKRIIIAVLITLQLIAAPAVYAQEGNTVGEKLRAIGDFFTAFFDLDNTFNYTADTFRGQCKRRDLFAIHDQKDALADSLIDDYRTLTRDQINEIHKQYSILSGELTFVRNIHLGMTQQEMEQVVTSSIRPKIRKYRSDITAEVPNWMQKYDGRAQDYEECETSWAVVGEQIKNIQQNAENIGTEWQAFKDQFNATSNELLNTPQGVSNAAQTVGEGIRDSYEQTLQNFQNEAQRLREELAREDIDTEAAFEEEVASQLAEVNQAESLAQILEDERRLTVIPQILREQQSEREANEEAALEQAAIQVTQSFTDEATFIIWNDILQLNTTIQSANELMSNDSSGVSTLVRQVSDRQCRL